MNRDNLVSLCSPADSAEGLEAWLSASAALLAAHYENFEIVLVGNGLRGAALDTVCRLVRATPRARLLILANHYDEDIVYSAALDTAIGDAVLLMDRTADPLSSVPEMLERILGGATIVLGHNLAPFAEPPWYRLLAACYYRIVEFLVQAPLEFDRSHFSAYSRDAVNMMTRHYGRVRNLRLLRNTLGVATETVGYRQQPGARRPFDLMSRVFARAEEALSFAVRPLRIVALLCMLAVVVNMAYGVYVLAARFLTATAPGWASAELAQCAMLSILFFALGIIAMHLNIILQETQRRPLYIILNEIAADTPPFQRRNVVA